MIYLGLKLGAIEISHFLPLLVSDYLKNNLEIVFVWDFVFFPHFRRNYIKKISEKTNFTKIFRSGVGNNFYFLRFTCIN